MTGDMVRAAPAPPRHGPSSTGALPTVRRASAVLAGVALARARLLGRPLALLVVLAASVAVAVAIVERHAEAFGAADRTLGAVCGLVVPLACFALVSVVAGRRRLGEAVWCAARFGHSRRQLTVGLQLGTMAVAALLAVLVVELALVASTSSTVGLAQDAWTSGWIAALGACAYVAWFSAGAAVLRLGRGRWIPLVLDFVLGEGTGLGAALWPRSHLRNLIGGPPPVELGQASSSAILLTMAVVLPLLASLRSAE